MHADHHARPQQERPEKSSFFTLLRTVVNVYEWENGAQGRDRTTDTAIFSRMLYQLSYLGAVPGNDVRGRAPVYSNTRPGCPAAIGGPNHAPGGARIGRQTSDLAASQRFAEPCSGGAAKPSALSSSSSLSAAGMA